MTQDILVGLVLFNVHKDIEMIAENVIEPFAKSENHKLAFIL